MHSERLLAHFQAAEYAGELPPPATRVRVENPACGDELELSARFDGQVLADVRFRARGCVASMACGNATAAWLTGKSKAEAARFNATELESLVDPLPEASRHAAVLRRDAVFALIKALS